VRRPTTTEEDKLIEAGFEYVRFDEETKHRSTERGNNYVEKSTLHSRHQS